MTSGVRQNNYSFIAIKMRCNILGGPGKRERSDTTPKYNLMNPPILNIFSPPRRMTVPGLLPGIVYKSKYYCGTLNQQTSYPP